MFRHILRPTNRTLTVRLLTHLLRPAFSEAGSNNRFHENKVYAAFTRYMREAAGKYLRSRLKGLMQYLAKHTKNIKLAKSVQSHCFHSLMDIFEKCSI